MAVYSTKNRENFGACFRHLENSTENVFLYAGSLLVTSCIVWYDFSRIDNLMNELKNQHTQTVRRTNTKIK